MPDERSKAGKVSVVEGGIYEVTITDIGERGDGMGKIDGLVIFVNDATLGQKVRVRVTRIEKKKAFGHIV